MKFRSDFVTNSSSSNFILQVKDDVFNEKQKEAILKYVHNMILGVPKMEQEDIDDFFKYNCRKSKIDDIKKQIESGGELREGWVSFEECEYDLGKIYLDLIDIIADNSDGNVTVVKGDLDY